MMGVQPYSYVISNGTKEYSYLIGSSQFEHNNQPYTISCFNTAYLPFESTLVEDQRKRKTSPWLELRVRA